MQALGFARISKKQNSVKISISIKVEHIKIELGQFLLSVCTSNVSTVACALIVWENHSNTNSAQKRTNHL